VKRALALALGFALAGCGGASHVGPATGPSCAGTNPNGVPFCLEVVTGTIDAASFASQCMQNNAPVSSAPCDRTGSVGGCSASQAGVVVVAWAYPPATASTVQQSCQANNAGFVLP
jgi:hypothetical protein